MANKISLAWAEDNQSFKAAVLRLLRQEAANYIEVLFTGLQTQPKVRMERINLIPGLVEKGNIFKTFSDCIEWLSKKHLT